MKRGKKPRPVSPCWYCGASAAAALVNRPQPDMFRAYKFYDVRDSDWWVCLNCYATTCYKPTSLGPGPIMPWGAMTSVMDRLVREERERARKLR